MRVTAHIRSTRGDTTPSTLAAPPPREGTLGIGG
jgi:hypothetical protein